MTIDEAIERNEKIIKEGKLGNVFEAYPALQLGIEALKAVKESRQWTATGAFLKLPGETEG